MGFEMIFSIEGAILLLLGLLCLLIPLRMAIEASILADEKLHAASENKLTREQRSGGIRFQSIEKHFNNEQFPEPPQRPTFLALQSVENKRLFLQIRDKALGFRQGRYSRQKTAVDMITRDILEVEIFEVDADNQALIKGKPSAHLAPNIPNAVVASNRLERLIGYGQRTKKNSTKFYLIQKPQPGCPIHMLNSPLLDRAPTGRPREKITVSNTPESLYFYSNFFRSALLEYKSFLTHRIFILYSETEGSQLRSDRFRIQNSGIVHNIALADYYAVPDTLPFFGVAHLPAGNALVNLTDKSTVTQYLTLLDQAHYLNHPSILNLLKHAVAFFFSTSHLTYLYLTSLETHIQTVISATSIALALSAKQFEPNFQSNAFTEEEQKQYYDWRATTVEDLGPFGSLRTTPRP